MQTSLPRSVAPTAPSGKDGAAVLRHIQAGARYVFSTKEFAERTGRAAGSTATKMALQRLARSGLITLAGKHPVRWLIIPPEQTHFGAPPVAWWLHDFLQETEPNYYVGLLSAARHWGSAHYALQTTQVLVSKPRPSTCVGRLRIDYFTKRGLQSTPTELVRGAVAPWRVSTREATLLDLIRHQGAIGGLEVVVRVCKDLGPELQATALQAALAALGQSAAAQRLGFVLEQLALAKAAAVVDRWLQRRRTTLQPLARGHDTAGLAVLHAARWKVQHTFAQVDLLQELR